MFFKKESFVKNLFIALTIALFSSSVFARQYIQCSSTDYSTTDVMVVNLQTENGGTLFISSGMQNDESERLLMKLAFDKKENGKHIYSVVHEGKVRGEIHLDSDQVGVNSNMVMVDFIFSGMKFEYSCFARIYND